MAKRWRIRPHDSGRIAVLEREARISPVVAQLLIARGICDAREALEFLNPKLSGLRDPELLPGVPEAADRLMQAIRAERPITVYGDYDADGITGTAIVHPRLPGSAYPFAGLSGAGVAFKLAWAICQQANDAKKVSPRMRDFLVQAVGLAAIGTVADVVPLVDENRILVRHGLASLP